MELMSMNAALSYTGHFKINVMTFDSKMAQ